MIACVRNGGTEQIAMTIRRRPFWIRNLPAVRPWAGTAATTQKVKGRKRSLIVDTLGLLLAVSISAASVQDRDAADDSVAHLKEKYPSLNTLFVDSAYAGKWAQRGVQRIDGQREVQLSV